jgi:hypothetical protein
MRKFAGTAAVIASALLSFVGPALAQGSGGTQAPSQAAAVATPQRPESGWSFVLYPIYGWLPIYRAETRLPQVSDPPGGGGPVVPRGETDGELSEAFLAGFRIEKDRFSLEGGALYAGLSGDAERPLIKLEADGFIADLRAGYEMMPDFYIEGGVRQITLDVKATIDDYPTVKWDPGFVEPVIGLTYRPLLARKWRLILHGDLGGLGTGDTSTVTATARVEWQPAKHLLLVLGGTVQYLETEGEIRGRSVELDQTLYGPIIGVGIPF